LLLDIPQAIRSILTAKGGDVYQLIGWWLPFFAEKMDTTKMSGSGCLTQNLEVKN
jgi:hypothetical protein